MEQVDGRPRCVCICDGECPDPKWYPRPRCPRPAIYHFTWLDVRGEPIAGMFDWIELCSECTANRRMSTKRPYKVHSLEAPVHRD